MLQPFSSIPGPLPDKDQGWVGNLIRASADPFRYTMDLRANYANIAAFVQGGNGNFLFPAEDCAGTVIVFGEENNRRVMTETHVFHSGPIIGPVYARWQDDPQKVVLKRVGTGLFSLNDGVHQQHRRLLMPAFHRQQISKYADEMVTITNRLLNHLEPDSQIDFQRLMFSHTLTVAGKTLFGQDFEGQADSIGMRIQEWLELIPDVSIDATDGEGTPYRRFFQLSLEIDDQIRDLIHYKRQHPHDTNDVLAALIHIRDEQNGLLSEDDLIGHINILLTAGHETTANAISWTVFLLTQHPEIAKQVVEELDAVLGDGEIQFEALPKLVVLDRVIKESLRILPPVTMGSRITAQETDLSGYHIPANTEVVFSHYCAHHDADVFANPERFITDRWLTISPSAYQYFPFSAGVRMCLGVSFAQTELKIVLASLLRKFRFEFVAGSKIDRMVWVPLRPNHMPMIVREQDYKFEQSVGEVRGNILEMVDFTRG